MVTALQTCRKNTIFLHLLNKIIQTVKLRKIRPDNCTSGCSLEQDRIIWYKNLGRKIHV